MQGDIRATIEDIRRVVHELRPPALDDLGLIPAIHALAGKIGRRDGAVGDAPAGLQVRVDAPDNLPTLPAAVEVAAYRIIQEALTNVVHHANAHCAVVSLRLEHGLHPVSYTHLDVYKRQALAWSRKATRSWRSNATRCVSPIDSYSHCAKKRPSDCRLKRG